MLINDIGIGSAPAKVLLYIAIMKFRAVFLFLFIVGTIVSQNNDTSRVHTIVETQAEFPGGFGAMMRYVQTNQRLPKEVKDGDASGKVFLKFIISETGMVDTVEVVKGIEGCKACDEEGIRLVKSMPRWKPATINGKQVKCYFSLPVNFKLSSR